MKLPFDHGLAMIPDVDGDYGWWSPSAHLDSRQPLRPQEVRLLRRLGSTPGEWIGLEEQERAVWGTSEGTEPRKTQLRKLFSRLRTLTTDLPGEEGALQSRYGHRRRYLPPRSEFAACERQWMAEAPEIFKKPSMALQFVPGGSFVMGRDSVGGAERPSHRVRLTPFFLSTYTVSNAEYQRLERSGGRSGAARTLHDNEDFGDPGKPVVETSWKDARDYCLWARENLEGMGRARLPTEAEWEYAARGLDGRRYPWGNDPPEERRAHFVLDPDTPPDKIEPPVDRAEREEERRSPFGVVQMAGNVWEHCLDLHLGNYIPLLDVEWNPAALSVGVVETNREVEEAEMALEIPQGPRTPCRSLRGGPEGRTALMAATRGQAAPSSRNHRDGIRVAVPLDWCWLARQYSLADELPVAAIAQRDRAIALVDSSPDHPPDDLLESLSQQTGICVFQSPGGTMLDTAMLASADAVFDLSSLFRGAASANPQGCMGFLYRSRDREAHVAFGAWTRVPDRRWVVVGFCEQRLPSLSRTHRFDMIEWFRWAGFLVPDEI